MEPLTELEPFIDEMRSWIFSDGGHEEEKFRDETLKYLETTWINGSFPPKVGISKGFEKICQTIQFQLT